jgi:putative acetyltransferase
MSDTWRRGSSREGAKKRPVEHDAEDGASRRAVIRAVDPQGEVALSLLREAAIDVRPLYAAKAGPPWPKNSALGPRDVYVVAFLDGVAVGCGSIRQLDGATAEIQRMYVHRDHRRRRIGQAVLAHLEDEARRLGYSRLRLETGDRQAAAMAFYEASGYRRIGAFGKYANDPTSVCYERLID